MSAHRRAVRDSDIDLIPALLQLLGERPDDRLGGALACAQREA
jgi:hypothetical protein